MFSIAGSNAGIAIPARAQEFGDFSIAGIVTVPLGGATADGGWNVYFGGEHQKQGGTTKAFNGGDSSQFIGSVGLGFSY